MSDGRARRHVAVEMYDKDADFTTWYGSPPRRYILATIPRAGSTLCSIRLWQCGQLGSPLEYMNFTLAHTMWERLGYHLDGGDPSEAQIESYWRNIQKLRTSPNGVFGCKLFVCNLARLASEDPSVLSRMLPTHVVYLARRDLLGQAISYYRAQQSHVWFGGIRYRKDQEPTYDFGGIRACLVSICRQMAVWEKLFHAWGVAPLRLCYEELCAHPRRTVDAVRTYIGVPKEPSARLSLPIIVRQADGTSEQWRAQFLRDARDAAPFESGPTSKRPASAA